MSIPLIKSAFSAGEISPSLWGRIDLQKWHASCSVARNMIVSYKGGMFSRAGTKFVGACKQLASASSHPPRNIPFSFNIFQSYILEFGDQYMRVVANGAYVTEAPKAISAASQADPCVITSAGHGYSNGDWVYIVSVGGMTELNGRTFIIANVTTDTFSLEDVFGDAIDARFYSPYTSGGTVARVYTLTTPYAAKDLPYLKYTQSKDVMSLTCVNQQTQTDYPPQELTRLASNNWTIAQPSFSSSISPPVTVGAAASNPFGTTPPGPASYGYVVTAVAADGQESVASAIASVQSSVDIAGQYGTISVTWSAVTNAVSYNIYKATPDYTNGNNFTGQLFGYVGNSRALLWHDTNILPDFTITPPLHTNPFPGTGSYPGVVEYFQQRRVYAQTLNEPDTYFMSQPGAYLNFDAADPPIDSDSITGAPWAKQVNGVQWLLPMPGGCIIGTGNDAWQLSGTSGAGSPVTPAQQNAQQQESIGFSPILPPIKIGYSIVYGQALGSTVRELNYNFYFNIYAGRDMTILSSHLFQGFQLNQWAWAQEPYKVVWAVRDDGKMLSLTYLKDEEVSGWTRHDSNGLAASVAVASEPPVNAVYWIFKRYIPGKGKWLYTQERMDNRIWTNVEDAWCVDAALSLPQPTPAATLTANRAAPTNGCIAGAVIQGGANYLTNVSGRISDPTGTGAVVQSVTVVAGVITGYVVNPAGSGYSQPTIEFFDATGSGASAQVLLDKSVTFSADAAVFSSADVGSVVRMGGGIAKVTAYNGTTSLTADFIAPITGTIPNDPNDTPIPAAAGDWSITPPVSTVSGLDHLDGMSVTGLADGKVIPATIVENGQVNLSQPASSIVIGLPFLAQMQTLHADLPGEMIQGKRKRITGATLRIANSRGIYVGQDQPIAAAQQNQAELPWNVAPNFMTAIEDPTNFIDAGSETPLFTGDKYVVVAGDYSTTDGQPSPGMVAIMQSAPLPMEILAAIPQFDIGDMPN